MKPYYKRLEYETVTADIRSGKPYWKNYQYENYTTNVGSMKTGH